MIYIDNEGCVLFVPSINVNPIRYFMIGFVSKMTFKFTDFLDSHRDFSMVRSIDIKKLKPFPIDEISLLSKHKIIQYIFSKWDGKIK